METKIFILFTLLIVLPGITCLQAQGIKTDTPVINNIKFSENNHSQVMDILENLSNVYGPRLTFRFMARGGRGHG